VGIELVLGQGIDHQPGTQATHAVIEVKDDFGARMDVGGESGCFEIGVTIVERIEAKQGIAANAEGLAGIIGQREPTHITFVAVFLGHDVGRVLLTDRAVIDAHHATGVAIAVVFVGATTIPGNRFKSGVELQGYANAGEIDQVGCKGDVGADAQAPRVGQGVGVAGLDVVPALAATGTGTYFDAVLAARSDDWMHGGDAVLQLGEPDTTPEWVGLEAHHGEHFLQVVVVGGRSPEVELRAGNNRLALIEVAQLAGGAIHNDAVVVVGEDEVGLADTTHRVSG